MDRIGLEADAHHCSVMRNGKLEVKGTSGKYKAQESTCVAYAFQHVKHAY